MTPFSRRILRRSLVWKRHRGLSKRDVVLGSYPRPGGTWLAIMLAELLTDSTFDLRSGDRSVPMVGEGEGVVVLPDGGRLLRTHEPYRSEYSRSILLVRDPRDIVISYFHFQRDHLSRFDGSLDQFIHRFVRGEVDHYTPWHDHVATWLDSGERQIVVRYEDLHADPARELTRIAGFLDNPIEGEKIGATVAKNTFDAMREKEDRSAVVPRMTEEVSARFVRSGTVAGWRERLSGEQVLAIESVMKSVMEHVGYRPASNA